MRAVLDYPATGAWLGRGRWPHPTARNFQEALAGLGAVAVAAALRAGCRFTTTRLLPAGTLPLPGIGLLRCADGRARLSGRAGAVRITDSAGPHPAAARPLRRPRRPGRPRHPPARRRRPRLVGTAHAARRHRRTRRRGTPTGCPRAVSDRRRCPRPSVPSPTPPRGPPAGRDAHALLAATHPARAAETTALVRAVVPLVPPADGGPTAQRHRAHRARRGSWPSCRRTGESWPSCWCTRTHHTKLAVLDELVPLWRPGGGLHRVGWRRDPRPVSGVLQGAYAHLALLDLWWRARTGPAWVWRRRAAERFETCREQVAEALSVLARSDELTPYGREFVRHMGHHHAHLGVTARPSG
ncbi:hypothetical protein GCM10017687_34930 [Streptomyces echinatus]|uniref:aKG-HExxH-type peptide beta-hydroxylase n=1 Tax=Streptomyces echinatus TaxID=67293 RepID=UPI0031EE4549